MPVTLSQNALLKILNDLKLEPTLQKETDQIYIIFKLPKFEVPVFFGIISNQTLLQTIAYLPYELQEKTIPQTARMLHLLNRELDMPGFGMDEKEKLLFYRCVIPCINSQLDERALEIYLATTRIACETFTDAIALITTGSATVDDVLKEMQKQSP